MLPMAAPRISVMTKRKQSCENWPPNMSPKRKILKAKSQVANTHSPGRGK